MRNKKIGNASLNTLHTEVHFVLQISVIFALQWFTSNYINNYALAYASITLSVILNNTNPTWVYIISISCIVQILHRKTLSLLNCYLLSYHQADSSQYALQDNSSEDGNILGNILTVCSAILFAFYIIFVNIAVPEELESTLKFSWFLGFIRLINDIAILTLFFIFDWTGLEVFEWPNQKTFIMLTINALINTVISDYCWARSVVHVGPQITSLGITLTFPIIIIVDYFVNDKYFSWAYYVGSFFIFWAFRGFCLSTTGNNNSLKRHRRRIIRKRSKKMFNKTKTNN